MAAAARRAIPLVLIFLVSAPLYAADASGEVLENYVSFFLLSRRYRRGVF
jgi:hypothetical protein